MRGPELEKSSMLVLVVLVADIRKRRIFVVKKRMVLIISKCDWEQCVDRMGRKLVIESGKICFLAQKCGKA